jgi:Helitron helicase-like domain at N-terminus
MQMIRPWDRLRLPRGWSELLEPPPPIPASLPAHLPAPLSGSASRHPWGQLRLPEGWSELLEPPPPIPASLPAQLPAPLSGSASQRSWDQLRLHEGWSEILESPASIHALSQQPAPPALPAPASIPSSRRARQRVPRGWSDLQEPVLPANPNPEPPPQHPNSWIFVESALLFHHHLERYGCPVVEAHCLGLMDLPCPHCHALFFQGENQSCCMKGTVHVPEAEVPSHLHDLITSPDVMPLIRVYNMALSMASTGHKNVSPGWGMFTLGGKTFHRLSANYRNPCGPPNFAQIFMLDTTAATARRLEVFRSQGQRSSGAALQADVLSQLHDFLIAVNPWIMQFRTAGCDVEELSWRSCGSGVLDGMGLGAMVSGSGSREIVIRVCQGAGESDVIRNIPDDHHLYHPLAYVLLFPTGVGGWSSGMSRKHFDGTDAGSLTLSAWAHYIIQRRVGGLSHLQSCGPLTSEFWCDVWAQVESRNLGYLRRPQIQATIRAGRYSSVVACVERNGPLVSEGVPIIMPASFVGSPKWYRRLYHDAMALPINLGHPDIFLTMTCNPQWSEIQDHLPPGADPLDHPDLVARVFYAKWKALLRDIVEDAIFGEVLGFCWRVEWQFRGWPHVHCMIILRHKIMSPHQVDGLVSAEIPDPVMFPELHQMVCQFMIHGPFCGDARPTARCRQKDAHVCRWRFPKDRSESTIICSNQFPIYRRRQRFTAVVRRQRISDEWVAPYNGLLLLRYRCHLNLEVTNESRLSDLGLNAASDMLAPESHQILFQVRLQATR